MNPYQSDFVTVLEIFVILKIEINLKLFMSSCTTVKPEEACVQ